MHRWYTLKSFSISFLWSTYVSNQHSDQVVPYCESESYHHQCLKESTYMKTFEDVSMYTNVSECKVWAILAHHNKTGEVVIPKHKKPSLYRKLQEEDLQVFLFLFYCPFYFTNGLQHLYKTLSSTPDVYLNEQWLELIENHGVEVGTSAIWRTLVKGGYTMKKVCETDQLCMSDTERCFSFLTQHLNGVWRSNPYS